MDQTLQSFMVVFLLFTLSSCLVLWVMKAGAGKAVEAEDYIHMLLWGILFGLVIAIGAFVTKFLVGIR